MPSLLGEWPDWGVKKGRERGRKGERQGGRKDEEGGEKKGTEGVGEENKCESEFLFLGWLYKHIYNFFFPPWMFPHQGSNPCPLQWKHGVITIGLPGDFLLVHLWPGYKGTRTSGEPSSSFRFEDHMRNPGLHFELSVFQSSPKFVSKPVLEKTAWGGQDRVPLPLCFPQASLWFFLSLAVDSPSSTSSRDNQIPHVEHLLGSRLWTKHCSHTISFSLPPKPVKYYW